MAHLPGKPEEVNALTNMLGGECVPRLVRVTIAHASFFQGRHPCFFTDRIGVRPGFSRFRIAEYELTFHKRKLFLCLQGCQRLPVQFHLAGTGFCLGAFEYPTTLAACTWAVFAMVSRSGQRRAHSSELRKPVLKAKRNRFSHSGYLQLL